MTARDLPIPRCLRPELGQDRHIGAPVASIGSAGTFDARNIGSNEQPFAVMPVLS
jgi:hypothetical protein